NKDAANEFFSFGVVATDLATQAGASIPAPASGTMSNIKVNLSVASGGGGYAVEFHSGANTLSCTVSAAGLTTCGAGTLSVTAGLACPSWRETNTTSSPLAMRSEAKV